MKPLPQNSLAFLAGIATDDVENTPRNLRELAVRSVVSLGSIVNRVRALRARGWLVQVDRRVGAARWHRGLARSLKVTATGWAALREVREGKRCGVCGASVPTSLPLEGAVASCL